MVQRILDYSAQNIALRVPFSSCSHALETCMHCDIEWVSTPYAGNGGGDITSCSDQRALSVFQKPPFLKVIGPCKSQGGDETDFHDSRLFFFLYIRCVVFLHVRFVSTFGRASPSGSACGLTVRGTGISLYGTSHQTLVQSFSNSYIVGERQEDVPVVECFARSRKLVRKPSHTARR